MNLNEMQRITLPALPNPDGKDQKITNIQLIECIKVLLKRDEDKEKRIRALEKDISHGVSKTTVASMISTDITKRITVADSPYTVLGVDYQIYADTDTGAIIINLPSGTDGKKYCIRNCGGSGLNLTINPYGAELILGANIPLIMIDGEVIDITYQPTEGWF